jgi:DNA-directed RNA polymerase sigma subunit (sigma70/sigma32)
MTTPSVNFDETSNFNDAIGRPECTLEEVGRALGISRSKAQRIEKEALSKVRDYLLGTGLSFDDFAR